MSAAGMRIVACYSLRDKSIGEQMEAHLRGLAGDGALDVLTDRIGLSQSAGEELARMLAVADMAVLLISADFLASTLVRDAGLPRLLQAQKARGLRIFVLFAGSADLGTIDMSGFDQANRPDRPLALQSRARRAVVLADLVSRLRAEALALGAGDAAEEEPFPSELIPSSGRLFDRVEDRAALARFLKDRTRRVCILRGLPGIGKSVLVAQIAERSAGTFDRVCWIRCGEDVNSADAVFARLDLFLRAVGDGALKPLRRIADETQRLDRMRAATITALGRRPFLIIFDGFGSQLGPAHEIRDKMLSRLVEEFAALGKTSKMILVTDRRLSSAAGTPASPAGTIVERELFGLPADAVCQLMKECGIPVDLALGERVATQLSGNPTAIRMLCSIAIRDYRDPAELLDASIDPGAPLTSLLERAVSDLTDEVTSVLVRLSLLRLPVGWEQLGPFDIGREPVVTLLDRSLLRFDPASRSLIAPELVRQFVNGGLAPADGTRAHLRLARSYEGMIGEPHLKAFDRAKLQLEAGYHHICGGNAEAGATAALPAIDALISWGRSSLAEDGIAQILTSAPEEGARAEALYQQGRIADQRGALDDALAAFEAAGNLTRDERLRARCLFYRGRIKSARGELAEGRHLLEHSIALAERIGRGPPLAAALLALAWNRKEDGIEADEMLDGFRRALETAEAEQDLISASDAHRQLGFLGWTFAQRREPARLHYARALRLARRCHALPQQAAMLSELGYLVAEWGSPDRAVRYCIRAMRAAREVADEFLLPSIYVNLALAYRARREPKAARAWLEAAIRAFRRTHNPGGEAYARYELGQLLAELDERELARKELERSATLCRTNGLGGQLDSVEAALVKLRAA